MSTPDVTLVNLNMLAIRYVDALEVERHVPLGPLYLTSSLEAAGLSVDFRDYQLFEGVDPFRPEALVEFCANPGKVIGLSCMANLLPFTILAARELKEAYPDRPIVLGGVGPVAVEQKILDRFPWIDAVAHGEGERSVPHVVKALLNGRDLDGVPGLYYRANGSGIRRNPAPPRIEDLEALPRPAYDRIDYSLYAGHNIITSRGCPYLCSFCSVAPIWGRTPHFRDPRGIVDEMAFLHEHHGVELFLFQDEFFVSSKERVHEFCGAIAERGLDVKWKAFARVNLTDRAVMEAMAKAGCVEIRFGIECGSDTMLEKVEKGFSIEQAIEVVSEAVCHFPRVDTFFIWGFPFETMDDFYETLGQMLYFRLLGARILPSLLTYLPQTEIYKQLEDKGRLQFYPGLLPEYMLTGHEICADGYLQMDEDHKEIFDFVQEHPDIFPGFFLLDVEGKILPKFRALREHGFYGGGASDDVSESDSCGAHSPRLTHEQVIGTLTSPEDP